MVGLVHSYTCIHTLWVWSLALQNCKRISGVWLPAELSTDFPVSPPPAILVECPLAWAGLSIHMEQTQMAEDQE